MSIAAYSANNLTLNTTLNIKQKGGLAHLTLNKHLTFKRKHGQRLFRYGAAPLLSTAGSVDDGKRLL